MPKVYIFVKMTPVYNTNFNIDIYRSFANILTNSTFNKLVRKGETNYLFSKVKKYGIPDTNKFVTYKDYFLYIHDTLKNNYRNEFIYKNYIIDKLLLGKHSLNTTTVINEFRINKSIADLVLLNGTSKVFEIKTELDKPARLASQISDYRKLFKEIYIVTHHSLKDKYLNLIDDEIGLMVLTENFTLKTIREAQNIGKQDAVTIMKSLRKSEYSNIIRTYFGYLPEVSDFKYFNACMDLFIQIPIEILYELMIDELKKRSVKEKLILSSDDVPKELKFICMCLDFDKQEYSRLNKFLNRKIK